MKLLLDRWTTFTVLLLLVQTSADANGQSMDFDQIRAILNANSPAAGDPALRDEAILNLDEYLKSPTVLSNPGVAEFYIAQMDGLADEIASPISSGARIWQMYNHGFIVKTPSSVFAFDLVDRFTPLPDEVLQQVEVSFISHSHGDHMDTLVQRGIRSFGGEIIRTTDFPLQTEVVVDNLRVVAYEGLHSDLNYIFHITTPEGLTVMHTGDTQRSIDLPSHVPVDILLINAWMNESGSQPATTGVKNGINRVSPSLTIPGHIQELGHLYDPTSPRTRVPYEWMLAVDDVPIPGALSVMAWGEVYEYNVVPEASACALAAFGSLGLLSLRPIRGIPKRPRKGPIKRRLIPPGPRPWVRLTQPRRSLLR